MSQDNQNKKRYRLHMIGNAHIDPVWAWRWSEGEEEVLATCRSALDRMREFPEFVFSRSSAATYEWIELDDPALFEMIKHRVSEGRWDVVGGWWVQPDCNIPCGESYVRQGLYGKLYFREKLNVDVRVGYNVDTFGHNAQLPQILKKLGLDYYVFMRPNPDEKVLPAPLFWWEAPDGSRVLTWRVVGAYGFGPESEIREHVRRCAGVLSDGVPEGMCFYGVGNHGGGPTVRNIRTLLDLRDEDDQPEIVFSTPQDFFDSVLPAAAEAPVVHDDLQHHARGCYTSITFIKRMNRVCEEALIAAESWALIAHKLTGSPAPQEEIERAWHGVLFNQFHDIMAGTAIPLAYDDSEGQLEGALRKADVIQNDSLDAIALKVNTEGEGIPVVIFNSLPWARKAVVECELGFPGEAHYDFVATGAEGRRSGCNVEVTGEVGIQPWRKLTFVADLPALGHSTYFIQSEEMSARVNLSAERLATSDQEIGLDAATGSIVRWQIKERDLNVEFEPAGPLVVINDPEDTWAHRSVRFRDEVGRFEMLGEPELVRYGPVGVGMRFRGIWNRSVAEWEYVLMDGTPYVELHVRVDWQERHRMLKLAAPRLPFDTVATFSSPYGFIMRKQTGEEEPAQQWVDVSGRHAGGVCGLSLITESTYGYDIQDSEIRASLLRSPIFCFHDPAKPRPGVRYQYVDQGMHDYRVWLLLHPGGWRAANTARLASELVNVPVVLPETHHDGTLAPRASFLEIGPENVNGRVLKQSEHAFEDTVVRFYETTGEPARAYVRSDAFGWNWEGELKPCEIKTLRINQAGRVWETDLLEEEIETTDS